MKAEKRSFKRFFQKPIYKPGWLYHPLFDFFKAGGWIALSPGWVLEKFVYEVKRRHRVRVMNRQEKIKGGKT